MTTDRTATIAELNDFFRMEDLPELGRKFLTDGIASLDLIDQWFIMDIVADYDDFTKDNDPHGKRDFGAFDYEGHKVFWKIDYYNEDLAAGSEDPADPDKTTRVLTTMLASEY